MKKDFFDIQFFFESSEITSILQFFPHRLHDTYKKLWSFAHLNRLETYEPVVLPIEYNGEVYFELEVLREQASFFSQFLKDRIAKYLEFKKVFYSYQYYRDATNDLLGFLTSEHRSKKSMEVVLLNFLSIMRSKIPVEKVRLFAVREGFKISLMGEGPNFSASLCELACATLAANHKKAFVSNNPLENATYLSCDPKPQEIPRNFIYAPLIHNGEVLAVIELKNHFVGDFSEREMEILRFGMQVICQHLVEQQSLGHLEKSEQTSIGLQKYISENVVTHIKEKKVDQKNAGGKEKEIIVLFAKINNFSEISEKLSASSLIDLLNYHHEFMAKIIVLHGGTIDKIIGHVIMAVWNHTSDEPSRLEKVIGAAVEMQKISLLEVAPVWQRRGILNYGIGIGINQGKAVIGNLGAKEFMDFTVIGDTINLAQRLQSKASNGEIWVRKEIVLQAKDLEIMPDKCINGIKIKGKSLPINAFVFTPLG